jgi:hypothetical protein
VSGIVRTQADLLLAAWPSELDWCLTGADRTNCRTNSDRRRLLQRPLALLHFRTPSPAPLFTGIAHEFAPKLLLTSTEGLELNSIFGLPGKGMWKVVRKGGFEFWRCMLLPGVAFEIKRSTFVRRLSHAFAPSWCQNWCQAMGARDTSVRKSATSADTQSRRA